MLKDYQISSKSSDNYQNIDEFQNQTQIRRQFIKKVYATVAIQLFITFFFSFLTCAISSLALFQMTNLILLIIVIIATVIIQIIIFCTSQSRKYPNNYILCGIFTLCQSYIVSTIVASYAYTIQNDQLVTNSQGMKIILIAIFLTVGLISLLTFYAWQTKVDYTQCYSFMIVLGFGLISLFVLSLIFPFLSVLYSIIVIVVFGFYLVYDTQLVMGRGEYKLDYEDYIIGAMIIYIDIIVLFLQILKLVGYFTSNNE